MAYSFGGNADQRQFLAQALLQSGQNNGSPLARGLGAFAGTLLGGKAIKQKEDEQKLFAQQLSAAKTPQERQQLALQSQDPKIQQLGLAEALRGGAMKPMSGVGKIQADLAAGLIDPQTAQAAMQKATTVAPLLGTITPYQQRQLDLQERKISAQERKAATGTALPRPVVNDLTEKASTAEGYGRLMSGFKPEYGNYGNQTLGNLTNTAKRAFGDDTGQAQWWQDYDAQANVVRHQLFGAALSAGEQAAWEKAAINPGMNSEQIRQNLARQDAIVKKGLKRLADTYRAGGYNQDQIDIIMGGLMQGGGAPDMALPGANVQGMTDAEKAAQLPGENIPTGQSILPPGFDSDPRVLKARQAGYSDEEIMQYIGGGK